MPDISVIEFLRPTAPFRTGERAGFDPLYAQKMIDKGVARLVKAEAPVVDPKTAAEHQANLEAAARSQGDNSRRPAASQRGA